MQAFLSISRMTIDKFFINMITINEDIGLAKSFTNHQCNTIL